MEQPANQDSEVVDVVAAEEVNPQTEDDQSNSSDDVQIEPIEDEEIDYEGEKFKVPKKLKEAFLRQSDYTRKTQEVAEQRKAVETERQAVAHQARMSQQYTQEVAEAIAIDKQIEKYQQLDWKALIDSDPVTAMKLDHEVRELQDRKGQVIQSLTQKQQQHALQTQQETAKRLQEANDALSREIPNWSEPETKKALRDYGKTIGFNDDELVNIMDARAIKLLHKAMMYDQLLSKQVTKPKPETQEKPVARITATKANAKVDPDKLSADDWLKWRNSQLKRRA